MKIVSVEKHCKLPPKLKLPAIKRLIEGCPEEWSCYDKTNAGALALRVSAMADWIVETRRRCEPTTPSTRPVRESSTDSP